jgi:hypothetical protein
MRLLRPPGGATDSKGEKPSDRSKGLRCLQRVNDAASRDVGYKLPWLHL